MERTNAELWLQGMYVYEALCDVSPVLVAYPKKGAKVAPYAAEPYPISKDALEKNRAAERNARMEQLKARLIRDSAKK